MWVFTSGSLVRLGIVNAFMMIPYAVSAKKHLYLQP